MILKETFSILVLILAFGCNEPMQVTGNPDDHSATSGTLGSANSENQLPGQTIDTTGRRDTVNNQ